MRERARLEREFSHLISGLSHEGPLMRGPGGGPLKVKLVEGGGATPGAGEGIDLIFIMKSLPGEVEPEPQAQFIKDLTKYVKTVLRGQQYKEVYNVDDIIDHLAWILWKSRGREKVRRIRIIAHGQESLGGVKMALRLRKSSDSDTTPKPAGGQSSKLESKREFVLPSDLVKIFVNKPNREVIRAAMTKDALVEFWGCYIADVPGAGSAWSSIFESTFRATSEEVMAGYYYYTFSRKPASPDSSIVPLDRVLHTSEIDRLDKGTQKRFTAYLLKWYNELVRNGDILPVNGVNNQIKLMRDIFDSSDGDIKYLLVNIYVRGPKHIPGRGRKVRPGDPAWNRVWRDFKS